MYIFCILNVSKFNCRKLFILPQVGSIEAFQGQEAKVVILSLVRSSGPYNSDVTKGIGFVSCAKRFNVALTRAKSLLVVVGNSAILSQDKNWKALVDYCKDLGCYLSDSG